MEGPHNRSRFDDSRPSITGATEDGRFTSRISKDIRHEPEIEAKLEELDTATKAYLAFDMDRFQSSMNKELESHITRLNQEYKQHQASMGSKLD